YDNAGVSQCSLVMLRPLVLQPQNIPVSSSSMCLINASKFCSGSDSIYSCHRELRSAQYSVHFEVLGLKRSCANGIPTHSEGSINRGRASVNVTELPRILKVSLISDLSSAGIRFSKCLFSLVSTSSLMRGGNAIHSSSQTRPLETVLYGWAS